MDMLTPRPARSYGPAGAAAHRVSAEGSGTGFSKLAVPAPPGTAGPPLPAQGVPLQGPALLVPPQDRGAGFRRRRGAGTVPLLGSSPRRGRWRRRRCERTRPPALPAPAPGPAAAISLPLWGRRSPGTTRPVLPARSHLGPGPAPRRPRRPLPGGGARPAGRRL